MRYFRMNTSKTQWHNGFTLIEVMIALLIIAIALVTVIKVNHTVLNAQIYLEDKLNAVVIANNTIAEIQCGLVTPPFQQSATSFLNKTYFKTVQLEAISSTAIEKINVKIDNASHQNILTVSGFWDPNADALWH
jgi:type II secretion system protein I